MTVEKLQMTGSDIEVTRTKTITITNCTKNLDIWFLRYVCGQKDIERNMQIAILCTPPGEITNKCLHNLTLHKKISVFDKVSVLSSILTTNDFNHK